MPDVDAKTPKLTDVYLNLLFYRIVALADQAGHGSKGNLAVQLSLAPLRNKDLISAAPHLNPRAEP
jgi:hypothetical protein